MTAGPKLYGSNQLDSCWTSTRWTQTYWFSLSSQWLIYVRLCKDIWQFVSPSVSILKGLERSRTPLSSQWWLVRGTCQPQTIQLNELMNYVCIYIYIGIYLYNAFLQYQQQFIYHSHISDESIIAIQLDISWVFKAQPWVKSSVEAVGKTLGPMDSVPAWPGELHWAGTCCPQVSSMCEFSGRPSVPDFSGTLDCGEKRLRRSCFPTCRCHLCLEMGSEFRHSTPRPKMFVKISGPPVYSNSKNIDK